MQSSQLLMNLRHTADFDVGWSCNGASYQAKPLSLHAEAVRSGLVSSAERRLSAAPAQVSV